MRIGLPPPMEVGCGPANAPSEADMPRLHLIPPRPILQAQSDGREPAIYGGSHVDLDHQ
jgi:hypothetical protein